MQDWHSHPQTITSWCNEGPLAFLQGTINISTVRGGQLLEVVVVSQLHLDSGGAGPAGTQRQERGFLAFRDWERRDPSPVYGTTAGMVYTITQSMS